MSKRNLTSALFAAILGAAAGAAGAADASAQSTDFQRYQRYLDAGSVKSAVDAAVVQHESGFQAYQIHLDQSNGKADGGVVANHAAASTYTDYQRVVGG